MEHVHSSSSCAKHGVLRYIFLHHMYWNMCKLSRIYTDVDPTWYMPPSSSYSAACVLVLSLFAVILNIHIWHYFWCTTHTHRSLPVNFTFWCSSRDHIPPQIPIRRGYFAQLEKKNTTSFPHPLDFFKLEMIKYTLRGSLSKFHKVWQPFLTRLPVWAPSPPLATWYFYF